MVIFGHRIDITFYVDMVKMFVASHDVTHPQLGAGCSNIAILGVLCSLYSQDFSE